ncbi:hypothetical protein MBLNU230_g8335t1 [Neophaeotheca triangularis]
MASKRAPLASVPHAVNSPFRNPTASHGKRARAQAGEAGVLDVLYGQPPLKKQMLDAGGDTENIDPRRKAHVTVGAQDKLDEPFGKRPPSATPTQFARKLAAVRDPKPAQSQKSQTSTHKAGDANLDSIRQWQRHYRKQFPSFVFFFEGVADDVRYKAMRDIKFLGAREERFFSKAVTHVVTSRAIPPELATNTSPDDDQSNKQESTARSNHGTTDQRKTTSLLDANLQRRGQVAGADANGRRSNGQPIDVLYTARTLNIKIWALEKLQRILKTMLDTDTGEPLQHADAKSAHNNSRPVTKTNRDDDLEQALRKEKFTGAAAPAPQEMTSLRGCYIYVRDMDEATKPTLVRDYNKPSAKDNGKWPQLRLTAEGRCPFIEDPVHTKKLAQKEANAAAAEAKAAQQQRKTRASSTLDVPPRPSAESQTALRRSPRKLSQQEVAKPLDPPKMLPVKRQDSVEAGPPLFGSAQASLRGVPRMIGGEPVASGIQRSNATSAIRSQAVSSNISSTAPALARRAGDSKEVSVLKRKVLERGHSTQSQLSMPSSYMNDMRAAINNEPGPPQRAAKRKAQETLGAIDEAGEKQHDRQRSKTRKPLSKKRKMEIEKEPKPGYCENCRDKYDDFEEHCTSRKHRKFAMSPENWAELDELLVQLKRPHKAA